MNDVMKSGVQPGDGADAKIFAARQPIVDRSGNLVAYELLFRGTASSDQAWSGELATAQVLTEAVLTGGLDGLTAGAAAFVNFTQAHLLDGTARLLSPARFVIEVLEDVPASPAVRATCAGLRADGYKVALDDVVDCSRITAFAGAFDIVKIDILLAPEATWPALVAAAHRAGALALAEKVETTEQMSTLLHLGFDYFQGYAVGRPVGVAQKQLGGLSAQRARLLEVVNQEEINMGDLSEVVSADPTLAYRVLAYANSARAAQGRRVESVRMALLLFGQDEIRRAASLLALASITGEIPEYLIIGSLVRARLCEDLAGMIGQKTFAGRYFLCGLLSNIDALLGRPLPEVLERLPVTEDVKEALVSHTGSMGLALDLATRYERADWETASGQAGELGIDFGALPPRYATAVREAARLVSVAPWDAAGSSGEGRAAAGGA